MDEKREKESGLDQALVARDRSQPVGEHCSLAALPFLAVLMRSRAGRIRTIMTSGPVDAMYRLRTVTVSMRAGQSGEGNLPRRRDRGHPLRGAVGSRSPVRIGGNSFPCAPRG